MENHITYKNYYAYIIFTIFTFIFFQTQLLGESWFWEDFIEAVYPIQTFAARESADFSIPFWNPYSFYGMPFFADIQAGFFYLPNRLMNLFLRQDGTLPVIALETMIIFHFVLSQIGMFHLSKKFKLSFWASIISSIIYSFSMLMICHTIHPMIIYHFSWFPLIFTCFVITLENNSLKYAFITALIMGHTMLSGHPQSTLYINFFLGIYFIWNTVSKFRAKALTENFLLKRLITVIIVFTLGAGLFAVQLLPSQELAELSQRREITYERAAEGSLEIKHFVSFVFPEIFGKVTGNSSEQSTYYLRMLTAEGSPGVHFYWETAFYFSVFGFIFGLIGIFLGYNNSNYLFLTVMSLFGILFALGSNGPLLSIFYNLPLFGTFRHPVRIMVFTILGFAILSGFAFDKLSNYGKFDYKIIIPIFTVVILLILGLSGTLFDLFGTPAGLLDSISSGINRSLFLALFSISIVYLLVKNKLNITVLGIACTILVFTDLHLNGSGFNKGNQDPEKVYKLDPSLENAFQAKPPNDFFRVNMRMYNPSYMALKRNQGMMNQIMLAEGYNPLILKRPVPKYPEKGQINNAMSVKYEIGLNQGRPQFFERFERNNWIWTSRNYTVINESDTESYMLSYKGESKDLTILEQEPPFEIIEDSSENDNLKILEYSNNRMLFNANVASNCLLVVSEVFYPAWHAFVNGQHVDIMRANHALRAIPLKAGENKIELVYESKSFLTGMWISIISFIIILIGIVVFRKY